ncbi:MAG: FkbM family methyltransferase [Mesorhizobium sp.]|uniref:FkbM family methyltransferase n=1 Tax=Mesorhizobium sp. TaxID=1871066 RepID=UPI000FEA4C3F|nr:FkbM family methyltransferase [Mesorhizobium sp.]RWD42563.1 MAG: FkbM family methyltransferase [Mesorhizobium sp.]RWE62671.1 MAG: FkbM family methyltransferase [Mesorhizobium sp.]RWF09635.1 MAG: FkbM family methyltransferase [Mesorhizobium sp.]RWF17662.1 MAG: FkbM family methyltransferase [Mesorhizobium sp.]TIY04503.1 MAG: FkbM family methyltransferase [Mesorhizobium sp.]
MFIAATGPTAQLATKLTKKTQKAKDVLRTEGLGRFLQLSALLLSEPFRSRWLRRRVATDARQALSKLKAARRSRGLFIDCGSNIGQGYKYFSRYYTPDRYDFVLVEPNKNCLAHLYTLRSGKATMEIIGKAASVKDGYAELFGPPPGRSEPTHQSCSIVPDHNESLYQSLRFAPDLVETFSLSQMIRAKHELYDVVVLKLDVEGAEYEILDDLIRSGVHRDLYAAYVEFHSLKMRNSERRKKHVVELQIRHAFLEAGTRFSEWI